ncbi:hypothetical protein [Burkholderia lata]|uniref:hypothetical protein n=1 Tax=Burkholderia lata (strain ATCC 17760 / DSM 23089 / LMG 22485 / NCIMB 9086 / R18194 / 383) TaxID=482957 RepID=UPI0012EAC16E|nr:hypothetical protein [Burkholderia lata]
MELNPPYPCATVVLSTLHVIPRRLPISQLLQLAINAYGGRRLRNHDERRELCCSDTLIEYIPAEVEMRKIDPGQQALGAFWLSVVEPRNSAEISGSSSFSNCDGNRVFIPQSAFAMLGVRH